MTAPTTIPGYADWARQHLTAFGLFTPAAMATLATWEVTFARMLADAPELADATAAMLSAAEAVQGYLDGHRTRLIQMMRAGRAAAARVEADDSQAVCVRCSGSGRLIVPHLMPDSAGQPRTIRAGHWVGLLWGGRAVFPECAVRCSCERGYFGQFHTLKRSRGGQIEAGEPLMTLADYERFNPQWQRQLAQRHAEQVAEAAHGQADAYDAALDRIKEIMKGANRE